MTQCEYDCRGDNSQEEIPLTPTVQRSERESSESDLLEETRPKSREEKSLPREDELTCYSVGYKHRDTQSDTDAPPLKETLHSEAQFAPNLTDRANESHGGSYDDESHQTSPERFIFGVLFKKSRSD